MRTPSRTRSPDTGSNIGKVICTQYRYECIDENISLVGKTNIFNIPILMLHTRISI